MAAGCDASLIFPPHWYYPYPPHELASLAALCRARGLSVEAVDANHEASMACLSSESLLRCGRRVGEDVQALAAASQRALDALRDPGRFYDPVVHQESRDALARAWRLVSRAHAPTEVDFLRLSFGADVQDLPACVAAAANERENPYLPFIRSVLVPRVCAAETRAVVVLFVHVDQIVPLFSVVLELRRAGWRGPVIVAGSLEDQLGFAKLLRADRHPGYLELGALIDHVIAYEAEPALPDLLVALRQGRPVSHIPNVISFDGESLVRPTALASAELRVLPPADFAGIDLRSYPFPEATLTLLGSRGCYWDRCTFCAIARNQLRYRARDPEDVAAEVGALRRHHGVRWVTLRDQLVSPAWLGRFSDALLAGGVDIRWTCRARFERGWTGELLGRAARAGCRQLWLGLESASERVLRAMDKGIELVEVERVLRACDAAGLGVHVLALHGFPGETDEEAETTVRFLEERASLIDSASYSHFRWFSDSPLFIDRARYNLRVHDADRGLLQYQFAPQSEGDSRVSHGRHLALHARVDRALPMPLVHVSHVAPFVDRHGVSGWRRLREGMTTPAPTAAP